MAETKAHRESLRDQIDKLVVFYEKFKPESGKCIQVKCSPSQLAKALGKNFPLDKDGKEIEIREWDYRGRTILSIG